jgi:hypothetical protein
VFRMLMQGFWMRHRHHAHSAHRARCTHTAQQARLSALL